MRQDGLKGAKRRGKPWRTTITNPAAGRSPDRVRRDFTATEPNRLWVGDFTYLRSWEGRLYFALIIGVYSRMIVGWQLASHMRTTLVLDALRMALGLRDPGADFQLAPAQRQPRLLLAATVTTLRSPRHCCDDPLNSGSTPRPATRRFSTTIRCSRRSGSAVGLRGPVRGVCPRAFL